MENSALSPGILFQIGPLIVTSTVVTTWITMLVIGAFCLFARSQLREEPGRLQTVLEGIVSTIEAAVLDVEPTHGTRIMPFVGSLWIFLVIANLTGLIPGLHSPTRDLSTTSALAFLVFLSVHWYGVRIQGWRGYMRHFLAPNPLLLPFNLISEISRTVALAVRLFGNMMSLEMAALLILVVAGFLAPVPILMLHIVEALVQAYIFGMLALIYVAGGMQSQGEF